MASGQGTTFAWRRFWLPRSAEPALRAGYLYDPESKYGSAANPGAITLAPSLEDRCLVLLGEPGSGKSYELERYARAESKLGARHVLSVDFRFDRSLNDDLFQQPKFIAWRDEDAPLTLVIDSLDEHPHGVHEVASKLVGQLRKGKVENLRLRIGCRSGEFPAVLEEQLPRLFGENLMRTLRLAPLRRVDVELAAGDGAQEFLAAIEAIGAQVLASTPITLELLVRQFYAKAALPATRVELYRLGCDQHCWEDSSTKSANPGDESRAKARRRYQVAARIAAVCILGGRSCMTLRGSPEDDPEALVLDDVLGGEEVADGQPFTVDRALLIDVVKTSALFVSASPGTIRWAHQTYCEFMAADYLVGRGLSSEQLHALLTGGGERTVGSMRELAAWTSSMNRALFERMVSVDPEPLLSSDCAFASNDDRARLVDAILERIDRGEAFVYSVVSTDVASKLRHPGLASQLALYISDVRCHPRTRLAAAYVAKLNNLTELAPLLGSLAIDPRVEPSLRSVAARAIARFNDVASRFLLRQLLADEGAGDEIVGIALGALWPSELTPEQLFDVLARRRGDGTVGSYVVFVSMLAEGLPLRALSAALDWTTRLPSRHASGQYDLQRLLDAVMRMGWDHLGNESVRPAFAKAVVHRFRVYDGVLDGRLASESNEVMRADHSRRRFLAKALVDLDGEGVYDVVEANLRIKGLVFSDDMAWLVAQLQTSTGAASVIWAKVAAQCVQFDGWTFDNANGLALMLGDSKELRDALGCHAVSVALGSSESRQMRKMSRHARAQLRKWMRTFRPGPLPGRSRQMKRMRRSGRRVAYLLEQAEAGAPEAAWRLAQALAVDADMQCVSTDFGSDLTRSPGWLKATPGDRARILSVARLFVLTHDENSDAWLGKSVEYLPSVAGYTYVVLLLREDPAWVEARAEIIWPAWAMICLAHPMNGGEKFERLALSFAQKHAPYRVEHALGVLLTRENESSEYPSSIFNFSGWSERTGRYLLRFLQTRDVKDSFGRELLKALVEGRVEGAAEWAATQLAGPEALTAARRVAFASVLLAFDPVAAWEVVWPELFADDSRARQILLTVADWVDAWRATAARLKPWSSGIREAGVGALYVRTEQLFPLDEDPHEPGVHFISEREQVKELKRGLLRDLSERGTADAVVALGRIQQLCPEVELASDVLSAKQALAQAMCRPLAPADVIALGREVGCRPRAGDALVVLFIASEWSSGRGGLTTFNRWFCCAWARERPQDRVLCAIDRPSKDDVEQAARLGVKLVHGILVKKGDPELGVAPAELHDARLDVVVGHGAISGLAAREQAERFGNCRRIHVLHVGSDEAEYAKDLPCAVSAASVAEGKTSADVDLAATADLALAVGPRLTRELGKSVHGHGGTLLEVLPALPVVTQSAAPPPGLRCLILGRIEDFKLKGVDLVAKALSLVNYERLPCRPELYVRGETVTACDDTKRRLEVIAPGLTVVVRAYTQDEATIQADICSATVLVMPSRAEGFGLVALEAIAAGVPVLVSDRSGFAEMLERTTPQLAAQFVVPVTGDSDATAQHWAQALERLFLDPQAAFERARVLKAALAAALDWGPTVRSLAKRVSGGLVAESAGVQTRSSSSDH